MGSSVVGSALQNGSVGRILLVDDEPRILDFVRRGLAAEGFSVDVASLGEEGLRKAVSQPYDLVILDLVMPGLDGAGILRKLLARKPSQAVLILSALSDTTTKVMLLELGAEDYLAKPFSLEELLARVRARIRGVARHGPTTIRTSDVVLDLVRREVDMGSGPVPLADREFLLLQELLRNAGRTVSKERLHSTVWGYQFDPRSNVVDVYVGRLRAKLGSELITTVRGEGYRIDAA
jgi:two-component system copper resistance phosphate regulon response regulator CusR